jgi:hypothetical protein
MPLLHRPDLWPGLSALLDSVGEADPLTIRQVPADLTIVKYPRKHVGLVPGRRGGRGRRRRAVGTNGTRCARHRGVGAVPVLAVGGTGGSERKATRPGSFQRRRAPRCTPRRPGSDQQMARAARV